MEIKVTLDPGAYMPEKAHTADAGFDLRTPERKVVFGHSSAVIDTGVHMLIPDGYVGMLKSKSGLNVKHGIQCEGVVDAGYTGSIVAKVYNNSDDTYIFQVGDKLTQIVLLPIPSAELLEVMNFDAETERGANGFGSSGK